MKIFTLALLLLSVAYSAETPAEITRKMSDSLMKDKKSVIDIIHSVIDSDNFLTSTRENDKKTMNTAFGNESLFITLFGKMTEDTPTYIGVIDVNGIYMKHVYVIKMTNGVVPMTLTWEKALKGYNCPMVFVGQPAEADLLRFSNVHKP